MLGSAVVGLAGCGADPYPGQPDERTLRIAFIMEMNGFDPVRASEDIRSQCVLNVYDALYQYAYLKRPYELEPCLAAAMPEVSPDGKVVRIRLKAGVRYVDDPCFRATGGKGREVVASDVVFCIKRLMDLRSDTKGSWILAGKVEGLDAFSKASAKAPPDPARDRYLEEEGFPAVSGLVEVDARTVEFRLVEPYPQLQWVLAMGYTSIYPPEAVATYGKDFLNHAVGTGAFRVEEYRSGQRLVLVRNPTYREDRYPSEASEEETRAGLLEDAGQRLPQVDRVIATVIKESQPRWLWFETGYLDVIRVPKDSHDVAIGPAPARALKPELAERGVALWKEPQLEVIFDAFNMEDPVVGVGEKAKAVRRAVSLATDYAWAAEHLYNGLVEDVQGPIPRDTAEWDPDFVNPWKQGAGETRAQALSRARAILAEAGFPGGQGVPEITMDVLDDTASADHFKAWKRDLAEIGLRLRPYPTDWQGMMHRVDKGRRRCGGCPGRATIPTRRTSSSASTVPRHPIRTGRATGIRSSIGRTSPRRRCCRDPSARRSTSGSSGSPSTTARGSSGIVGSTPTCAIPGSTGSAPATSRRSGGSTRASTGRCVASGRPHGTSARSSVPVVLGAAFAALAAGTLLLGRRRRKGW